MRNVLSLSLLSLLVSVAVSGPLQDLSPGQWYEVPNSPLDAVRPDSLVGGYFSGIIDAWSGGAFDTKRDNLIIWGGGHGDYAGNEVYTFSLDSLKWKRETKPSNPPAVDVPYAPDGNPCARHTYNYIQYVASIDRFCSFGGVGFFSSGQTGTNHTDAFNFDAKKWTALADCPSIGIGAFSAYDRVTGRAWCHGTNTSSGSVLSEFDPISDVWTPRTGYDEDLRYNYGLTAAIDPLNKKFVAVGKGKTLLWNIANPAAVTRHDLSTGPVNGAPGFDYDVNAKKLVAWSGGQSVEVFDAGSETWAQKSGSGAMPTAPNQNGTFGRWRYSPLKNVFVLVNKTSENVFLYRLSATSTMAVRRPVAAVSERLRVTSVKGSKPAIITIRLPDEDACSELAVYDLIGRKIADLLPDLSNHLVTWSPCKGLGVYVVKAVINGKIESRRFFSGN